MAAFVILLIAVGAPIAIWTLHRQRITERKVLRRGYAAQSDEKARHLSKCRGRMKRDSQTRFSRRRILQIPQTSLHVIRTTAIRRQRARQGRLVARFVNALAVDRG